jgi:hypothetical protein
VSDADQTAPIPDPESEPTPDPADDPAVDAATVDDASARRPAGMCRGPGHLLVYGNPAFVASFGDKAIGMPAREIMLDLPSDAFALFDKVLSEGKPLASWIRYQKEDWRLTVAPRIDPTGDVYGVSFHMRAKSDVPVVGPELPHYGPGRRFA